MSEINKLPTRRYAHPFDRPIKIEGNTETHGVDASPDAIGGCYGMGWREAFRCHKTGEIYSVHCSDGVNHSKSSHSDRDFRWMEEMRERIVNGTRCQSSKPIMLSSREWAVMLNFGFSDWLDLLPGEEYKTVGDSNRHLDEGQIGTIRSVPVVVDPKISDKLPPVGNFSSAKIEELFPQRSRATSTPAHEASKFGGVFADAFARARTAS